MMPWAAPITAIWTGFCGLVIGGKILCLALAPPSYHFNDAALHRFLTRLPEDGPGLEERNIRKSACRNSLSRPNQTFRRPAKAG
ncbi:hypothetical protein MES5069_150057 [Mesorhizobium escarrei]|uniref:Uncharacterized protein n=1 Tax=Mesorhizobium escarrei TaxID=666018 RepID=A0ABN8JFE9_9HYPH|nr:hypothetical protein MES5069_150057 [Mesorhizobium escarrei]